MCKSSAKNIKLYSNWRSSNFLQIIWFLGKNRALTTFRGRILHHLISILLKSQSAKAYLCYRVFLSRSRGFFFFFSEKNCGLYIQTRLIFKGGFYYTFCFNCFNCLLFTGNYNHNFCFHLYFIRISILEAKLPKPSYCCRIQSNSKQFWYT